MAEYKQKNNWSENN